MKQNILLINPHIEDFSAYDHFSKPLGLIWLAAYLEEHFNLHFVNALMRNHPALPLAKIKEGGTGDFYKEIIPHPLAVKDIPRHFRRYGLPDNLFMEELDKTPFSPDWIFVSSGMTYWYSGLQHSISLLRKRFPHTPIILGGIYASLMPEHACAVSGADYVISGQSPPLVLNALSKLLTMPELQNSAQTYRPPLYRLLNEYYYAPVMTSLGCVYHCSYCASQRLVKFHEFPHQSCADTILTLQKEYNVENFAFYDDALLYHSEKRLNPLLRTLMENGFHGRFYTPNGLHIRFLTKETATLMKESRFADIRLSLESEKTDFHLKHDQKAGIKEFEKSLKILHQAGFNATQIQVYTLVNLPGEDTSKIKDTLKYIHDNGGTPRLAFYSPIPGTPDFARAEKISDLSDPLSHNNTVYLYRSGIDMENANELKEMELSFRHKN